MLVIAPIFSRDVYSYAAQGEMVDAAHQPLRLRAVLARLGALPRHRRPDLAERARPLRPAVLVARRLDRAAHRATASCSDRRRACGSSRSSPSRILAVAVPVLARGARLRPGQRLRAVPAQPARRAHARRRRAQRRAHGRAARRGPRARGEATPGAGASSCARSRRRSRRPRRSASSTSPGSGSGRTCPCGMRLRPLAIAGLLAAAVLGRVHLRVGARLRVDRRTSTRRAPCVSWTAPATGLGMGLAAVVAPRSGFDASTTSTDLGSPEALGLVVAGRARRLAALQRGPDRLAEGARLLAARARRARPGRPALVPDLGPAAARPARDRAGSAAG